MGIIGTVYLTRPEIGGKHGANMEQIWRSYGKYGIGKDRG